MKDTAADLSENAIEFSSQYCHKGYGTAALTMFLERILFITGKQQFQALVETDNIPSQKLMEKLGAELIDIYEYAFASEEDAEDFEEENLDEITERMVELAVQLEVEPRKLLSHVLDYRLYVKAK